MLAQSILSQITAPITNLIAFRQVKFKAKYLILAAVAVFALGLGACAGSTAAPTFPSNPQDVEAASGAPSSRVESAPVSTLSPSGSPVPNSSTGIGGGLDYGLANEFDLVARIFGEAIHDDPYDPWAYNGRAAAYISLGRYRSAIVDLDQAIRLDSEYSRA